MNKQKVLDKLDEIHDVYEAAYDPSSWPSIEDLINSISDINDIAKDIQKEVNSKVKMPKVFDDWHKEELDQCSCWQDEIWDLINLYMEIRHNSDVDYELVNWLNLNSTEFSGKRFSMCIDAIINGYEVEK